MGLCKCPKRKVTNLFCFEHRVNVCEDCMVSTHPTCVVRSYLQWLQDSDYSPNCSFCDGPLAGEECVRLICYCVFRWSCLDNYCRSLPPDTAPAGYLCPVCGTGIFPPDNLVSPVADKLRSVLQNVNWARAGLGLPLLSDSLEKRPVQVPVGPRPSPEGEDIPSDPLTLAQELVAKKTGRDRSDTVLTFDSETVRRGDRGEFSDLAKSPLLAGAGDPDSENNKYKRRAPTDWLVRWWRTIMKPAAQRRRSLSHWAMLAVIIALAFLTLVFVFNYLGRGGADDPMLDPRNNPNIRMGI